MSTHKLKTREEAISFLKKHNFNYYVPKLDNVYSNISNDNKSYCIEFKDFNGKKKINHCYITIFNKGIMTYIDFFQRYHSYAYMTMEEGEKYYASIERKTNLLKDKIKLRNICEKKKIM